MPNSSDIAAQNRFVLIAIRMCVIVAIWLGLFPMIPAIAIGIGTGDPLDPDTIIPLIMGALAISFATLFWFAAPWLARKVVPNPTRVLCPSCGYDLADVVSDRCNECGLALSEEFRDGTVLQGPAQAPPARLFVLQGIMASVARIVAAVAILPLMVYALVILIQTVDANIYSTTDFNVFATFILLSSLGVLACSTCLIPWIFPRWTGRRLAPLMHTANEPTSSRSEIELNPVRSVTLGVARLIAAALIFPSTGFAIGFAIQLLDALNHRWSDDDVSLAVFSGMSFVGFLGITLCAAPWIFPKFVGTLLVPAPPIQLDRPQPETALDDD